MKKNIFTGKNSQIGQYFSKNLEFVSYDISDESTWNFLDHTRNLFFIVPKSNNTLLESKNFILSAKEAGVEHIVKIGSLGPWRVVHNQLNSFIRDCGIVCSNIDIAPLMNNIFTEQYQNQTLYNYRHQTPAPYLDPIALAELIENLMNTERPLNQNIQATGKQQYYIQDIKQILNDNNYIVNDIVETHNDKLHKNPSVSPDQKLMTTLGDDYAKGKFPQISLDLTEFGIHSRTFEEFVVQDKQFYKKSFEEDRNL
jgi:hypothetical protein